MDLFNTALELAGVDPPSDRIIDGTSLTDTLFAGQVTNRPMFYYRGDELMAVRYGLYKMHLWTWSNHLWQYESGIDFCPGMEIEGVTTHAQVNRTDNPVLIHLGRDPSERFPISNTTAEYQEQVTTIRAIVADHKAQLVPGVPSLNWCDNAAMEWTPPGCELINQCLQAPPSSLYRCVWDH
jgi:N-acetylgalactosamine-6-sulfatase